MIYINVETGELYELGMWQYENMEFLFIESGNGLVDIEGFEFLGYLY